VKSTVESVNPTRARLSVEVAFDELRPALDSAYRNIARQVRVPGFRPGRVPPSIIDRQVGRGAVLEEALQSAIPQLYGEAVREHTLPVLGSPDVEVTELQDGERLTFTAEVDVRPEISVPAYDSIAVIVDDAETSEEQVDEQLEGLRDRFAVLQSVDGPAEVGDFVSIDLRATVDGEEVPGATTSGLSYEVGTEGLVPGLDSALVGLAEGGSRTFSTQLVAGEYAGRTADVEVTVKSVKSKDLPDLDDDFAQTASEYDTLEELRADVRSRIERVTKLQQGVQARDRVLERLLDLVDVPLPEGFVEHEVSFRRQNIAAQLEQAGMTLGGYLEIQQQSAEDFDAELVADARSAVKTQLVLDAIGDAEQIGVDDAELTQQVVSRAQRAGVSPEQYAQQVMSDGSVGALVADVRRGKALAMVLEAATITDASGRPVDLAALRDPDEPGPAEAADVDAAADAADPEAMSEAVEPGAEAAPVGEAEAATVRPSA